jgi:hypothetical protein
LAARRKTHAPARRTWLCLARTIEFGCARDPTTTFTPVLRNLSVGASAAMSVARSASQKPT